ncbi:MAG: 16S rRNA (cytosine(1402)-N(4))-methyltransferase RsmH [Treponema sp.]|nr:16S rRNA (cytosine(1402)-N(4))-methyltransferase RsmH [Treponema sp.]
MKTEIVHTPVLMEETLQLLAPRTAGELMVDATMGEGGHSYAFLSRFPTLRIIGIDADAAIQQVAKTRLHEFHPRVSFYTGWSQDFFPQLDEKPDTILIDLGVSLYHYEKSGRGFSFLKDEPLDMRIDTAQGRSVAELIATLSERDLADLLYYNADERYSRRIAHAIVDARSRGRVNSTITLAEIVRRALPVRPKRGAHPATKTFQALRIAVNGELARLPALLEAALHALADGGRMGVISFHSLEDRMVKNFFRDTARDCLSSTAAPIGNIEGHRIVNLLTRKGIGAGADEIQRNPSSRSARLRVIEKILQESNEDTR